MLKKERSLINLSAVPANLKYFKGSPITPFNSEMIGLPSLSCFFVYINEKLTCFTILTMSVFALQYVEF